MKHEQGVPVTGETLGNHETAGPASVTVGPPNMAVIRQLVNAAFDDEEIVMLCFDYFHPVYDSFGSEMGKRKKIQVLLEECDRRNHGNS